MPRTYRRKTIKRKYRRKSRAKPKRRVVKKRKRRTKSTKSKRVTKRVTQAKRRVKLINKTIKRVQTKLADEIVTMRRMKPLATRKHGVLTGLNELDVRNAQPIDGQLCLNKYIGLPVKFSDWWTIDAFHGFNMPRYFVDVDNNIGNEYDKDWEAKVPWFSHAELFTQSLIKTPGPLGTAQHQGVDIRAYDQKEIPFLPCVPRRIDLNDTYWKGQSRLEQFCRKGERIKVRSNYMRFNFYVQAGMKETIPIFSGSSTYQHAITQPGPSPTSASTSTEFTGRGGNVKEWKIAAKSFAKARIIVVKRNQDHEAPINLNDFLKDNDPFTMGDEEYRMNKYFHRKYKNDNDIIVNTGGSTDIETEIIPTDSDRVNYECTKLKDLSNSVQRGLHRVNIMYDKVHNLRLGGETVVKLNFMKGTVLTYEKQNPYHEEMYADASATIQTLKNAETAKPEVNDTLPNQNDRLPVSTNYVLRNLQENPQDSVKGEHNEYVPKGPKYAAFLLLMNQKCSTEYQIFQKFDFDN